MSPETRAAHQKAIDNAKALIKLRKAISLREGPTS